MNYSIKYLAILFTSLVIATGCGVADTNNEDTQEKLRQVIFVSDIEGYDDLYLANVDGTGQKRITKNDLQESSPSISPDGSKIAYSQQGQIWIMPINGSQSIKVTGDDCDDEDECIEPSWSPDGDKLTYSRNGDIYIINIDGTETLNITESDGIMEYAPKWSPDGSELVLYGTDREGTPNLYTIDANGENRTQFTEISSGGIDEKVSPCWGTDNYIYLTTVNVNSGDAKGKAKATSHNASRSNRSNGIMSDIITNGDIRGVTCAKEIDKASPL